MFGRILNLPLYTIANKSCFLKIIHLSQLFEMDFFVIISKYPGSAVDKCFNTELAGLSTSTEQNLNLAGNNLFKVNNRNTRTRRD